MVVFNVTVEDSSPLITYSPLDAWVDAPLEDPSKPSYSGGSLHSTNTSGAQASFSFTGTGISLYGFNAQNFGDYKVTVDGKDIGKGTTDKSDKRKLLASVTGLSNGQHSATLVSSGSNTVNLDYIDVQHEAAGFSSMSTLTIDDGDTHVIYQPKDAWKSNDAEGFMNNTLHFSSTDGSTATLPFFGQAIALYGTVSRDHADISVTLDGRTTSLPGSAGSSKSSSLHARVLWYYAEGLDPATQHSISMSSKITKTENRFIDLDAFVIYSFDGSSVSSRSGGISKAAIIGPAVGGSVALIILIGILILFVLRRRKRRDEVLSPTTPTLPFQTTQIPPPAPPSNPPIPFTKPKRSDLHSIAPSYYGTSQVPATPPPIDFMQHTNLKPVRSFDQHSIAPSYYGTSLTAQTSPSRSHSRAASATSSTVPILSVPQPMRSMTPTNTPLRPNRPPEPLNIEDI